MNSFPGRQPLCRDSPKGSDIDTANNLQRWNIPYSSSPWTWIWEEPMVWLEKLEDLRQSFGSRVHTTYVVLGKAWKTGTGRWTSYPSSFTDHLSRIVFVCQLCNVLCDHANWNWLKGHWRVRDIMFTRTGIRSYSLQTDLEKFSLGFANYESEAHTKDHSRLQNWSKCYGRGNEYEEPWKCPGGSCLT